MRTLRDHLGGHDGAAPAQLCLTEVSSLVMRAGRAAGLRVRMEVPVHIVSGDRRVRGEIDCGWYSPVTGQLVVAWEFDGCNVGAAHIGGDVRRAGNASKFAACGAIVKVEVLYALKNDLSPWGRSVAARCRTLLGPEVRVISDEDLMAPGGIEGYAAEAQRLAGLER